MLRTNHLLLLIIVALGLFLRCYRLSDRPAGFTWDEAALGYNAYSLLQTGKDEWAVPFPIVFASFGDFKPGLYIYTAVPFIAGLGLTETATRLPSVVMGTLSILLIFVLANRLFPRLASGRGFTLGHFAALLLALNPWAIHFSRGAWEANLWVTLTLLGLNLLLVRRLAWSAVLFGLTLWTYQGAKLLTPLLLVWLCWFLPGSTRSLSKLVKPALLVGLFALPILIGLPSQSGRLKVFSLFSYTRRADTVSDILAADHETLPAPLYYLYHTEILNQLRGLAQRYVNHFSPKFLFADGDWTNLRQSTPYHGNFYLFEIVTLALGGYVLVRQAGRRPLFLLAGLILFSPLGSALSRDLVSGVRSLPLVIPITLISAAGLQLLWTRKIFVLPTALVLIGSAAYFLDLYFIHAPYYAGSYWLASARSAFGLVKTESANYDHVVITQKYGQPYIFTLFYLAYPPAAYQHERRFTASAVGDVGTVDRFGKFSFRPIYWPADRGTASTLYLSDEFELPESDLHQTPGVRRLGEFAFPSGKLFLRAVATP